MAVTSVVEKVAWTLEVEMTEEVKTMRCKGSEGRDGRKGCCAGDEGGSSEG